MTNESNKEMQDGIGLLACQGEAESGE